MQSEDEPFADRSKYCSLPAASGGYTKLPKPLRCAAKRYASCNSCLKANRPMVPQASLKAGVDELETLTDQRHAYLNNRTGETVSISDDEITIVENEEPLNDIPDWQREIVDIAREILHSDNYLELPSKYDIHDYAIIERFCQSQVDEKLRFALLDLIRGSGAFGRFKDAIQEFEIAQAWYQFRHAAYREIAIDWLEANDIPYFDDDK